MEGLDADTKKSSATGDQLRIWDRLLEIRIQFQKILIESNKLPQNEFQALIAGGESSSETLLSALKTNQGSVQKLLDSLLDLQDSMTNQNPDVLKSILGKRKSADVEDEEIPSDEEILSSEDEADDTNNTTLRSENDGEQDESEEDTENTGSSEEDDDDETKELDRSKKKRKIEDYEAEVQKRFDQFIKYRNETVQKWNDKTQLSAGNVNKRNYTAFQTSTLSQVEHILKDRSRLIKRTQLKRSLYNIIGKHDEPEEEGQVSDHDVEVFDDDDFYHQLLRELIDRKTSNVTDPIQLSRQWLQIQKLRSKMKRKVDTRASKGRKIRYDVHPKLVSFMAGYDNCSMTENAVKELMSSLFGNVRE